MYVLTKVESGYEGSDVEVITASSNFDLLNEIKTALDFKLKNDIDAWNNFKSVTYPLFLSENPKPDFNLDASVEQKVHMSAWLKMNTEFVKSFRSSDVLYDKEMSLETLMDICYEVTEVDSPENILKEVSSTM